MYCSLQEDGDNHLVSNIGSTPHSTIDAKVGIMLLEVLFLEQLHIKLKMQEKEEFMKQMIILVIRNNVGEKLVTDKEVTKHIRKSHFFIHT